MIATKADNGNESLNADYAVDLYAMSKSISGRPIVREVSMRINRGEIFGFLGPNGSGKTTCIRLMCGLLTPDSGQGTCLGLDIFKERALIKRQVGYMPQKFSLWDDLTLRENLDFMACAYEVKNRQKVIEHALEKAGLASRSSQLAGALSGGWKQRLALTACTLHQPKLLMLDEPTAGVDPSARRDFWDELHRLAAQGTAILVSTHYMDEAQRCHRLAYLAHGQVLVQGTAQEIINSVNLPTWGVKGKNLVQFAQHLSVMGITGHTVLLGSMLRISGLDEQRLQEVLTSLPSDEKDLDISRIEPDLEDVFIYIKDRSSKNDLFNSVESL